MKHEPVEVISLPVDSTEIMTEEQWQESEQFGWLVDYITGSLPEFQTTKIRGYELSLIKRFRPEYLKQLFSHMASGKVYESFGARLGITDNMRRRWLKEIPEWALVHELGIAAHLERWEQRMIDTSETGIGNATLIIAKLKSFRKEFNPERQLDAGQLLPLGEDQPIFHIEVVTPRDEQGNPKQIKQVNE